MTTHQGGESVSDATVPAGPRPGTKLIAGLAFLCLTPVLFGVLGTVVLLLSAGQLEHTGVLRGWLGLIYVSPMVAFFSPLVTVPGLVLAAIALRRVGRQHALGRGLIWAAVGAVVLTLIVVAVLVVGLHSRAEPLRLSSSARACTSRLSSASCRLRAGSAVAVALTRSRPL